MHTRAERKSHIAVDTSWEEVFDSSLDDLSTGRMQFIADLTNQHIEWSNATTMMLDLGCGSGIYISAMHGGENKHSLFIGLDLDLKGCK
jgi:ribosomal protein L11 methylase PrmA